MKGMARRLERAAFEFKLSGRANLSLAYCGQDRLISRFAVLQEWADRDSLPFEAMLGMLSK